MTFKIDSDLLRPGADLARRDKTHERLLTWPERHGVSIAGVK